MGTLFAYSIVAGILLVAMYPVYKWLLSGERQHGYNRAVLWMVYAAALLLPLVVPSLRDMARSLSGRDVAQPVGEIVVGTPVVEMVADGTPLAIKVLLAAYAAGLVLSLLFTVVVAIRLIRVISSGERVEMDGYTLIITPCEGIAPFSWMSYVVMSRADYEASGAVITVHETRHLALRHWIDLAAAQCVAVILWYNPAAWLMREELKAVHEYQADEAVMASGTDLRQYQMLLVKKAVGARFPSLANSLNHSKLKKRITMMYKTKSSVLRRMRALALVPAAAVALCATGIPAVASILSDASSASLSAVGTEGKVSEISPEVQAVARHAESQAEGQEALMAAADRPEKKTTTQITVNGKSESVGTIEYYVDGVKQPALFEVNTIPSADIKGITINKNGQNPVIYIELKSDGEKAAEAAAYKEPVKTPEKLPQFPGGERTMMKWLVENIHYPEDAVKENKEGRVVVRFTVGTDGRIKHPEVIRSVSPSLDAEAVRVVLSMPEWTPGENDGKKVDCSYVIPVSFKLQKDDESTSKDS